MPPDWDGHFLLALELSIGQEEIENVVSRVGCDDPPVSVEEVLEVNLTALLTSIIVGGLHELDVMMMCCEFGSC